MSAEPAERPTLNDLAALNQPEGGLECPACGCRHFHVKKTTQGDKIVTRRRECRHCGKRITTYEGP